jgi:thioredoxin-related protein
MKCFFVTLLASVLTLSAFAGGPTPVTDLNAALEKAKAENKLLFVQMGREACGNCQALREMIKKGDVRLSESKIVYADINCDDAATNKMFREKFKVEGSTLPIVAIAAPDGSQLAAHGGYGDAKTFEGLLRDAKVALKKQAKPAK